jgi:hypothetical protein
MAKTGIWNAF